MSTKPEPSRGWEGEGLPTTIGPGINSPVKMQKEFLLLDPEFEKKFELIFAPAANKKEKSS